jgi:hypothetical protein
MVAGFSWASAGARGEAGAGHPFAQAAFFEEILFPLRHGSGISGFAG